MYLYKPTLVAIKVYFGIKSYILITKLVIFTLLVTVLCDKFDWIGKLVVVVVVVVVLSAVI